MVNRKLCSLLAALLPLTVFASGAQNQPEIKVYRNAVIFTADEDRPWASAIATKGESIVAVGGDEDMQSFLARGASVENLNGAMVMPGLHDAHTHLLFGSLKFGGFNCDLPGIVKNSNVVLKAISNCLSDGRPLNGKWLVSGVVSTELMESASFRSELNKAFPNQPILLKDYSNHNAFISAAGLVEAGIGDNTADPAGGHIVRDRDGHATGMLVETAVRLAYSKIPAYDSSVNMKAIESAIRLANSLGFTSVQEASAVPAELDALHQLDKRGQMSLRVAAHMVIDNPKFIDNKAAQEAFANRRRYESKHVATSYAKVWLDGAPIKPNPTEVGLDAHGQIDRKYLLIDQEKLSELVTRLDGEGIKVKLHAAGAGSVRVALNAIEAARKVRQSGILHDVAHCNSVADADVGRFKMLGAVAEMSPAIWDKQIPGLEDSYHFGSFNRSQALMTMGSDWLLTRTPNLFPTIPAILNRGDQSLSLEHVLKMMTINGAMAIGKEATQGSLVAGKSADFIVLDRNIFKVPVQEIADVKVTKTFFEGRLVYEQK